MQWCQQDFWQGINVPADTLIKGWRFAATNALARIGATWPPTAPLPNDISLQIGHRFLRQSSRGVLIHPFRIVSFTRVCQPRPVARNAASTSGSKRNLTATLASGLYPQIIKPEHFCHQFNFNASPDKS